MHFLVIEVSLYSWTPSLPVTPFPRAGVPLLPLFFFFFITLKPSVALHLCRAVVLKLRTSCLSLVDGGAFFLIFLSILLLVSFPGAAQALTSKGS